MGTKMSRLLDAAAAAAAPVVRGIGDDQLDAATPCTEFRVRDLLNHLLHVVIGFQSMARKEVYDFATTPDYMTSGDWRARFEAEAAALVRAWADPSALDGASQRMGLPQPTVGNMILLDLTVHGWDLARATDQKFVPHPGAVESLHRLVDEMAPTAREFNVFGTPIPVPDGASSFDRLLCLTGRDPSWGGAAQP